MVEKLVVVRGGVVDVYFVLGEVGRGVCDGDDVGLGGGVVVGGAEGDGVGVDGGGTTEGRGVVVALLALGTLVSVSMRRRTMALTGILPMDIRTRRVNVDIPRLRLLVFLLPLTQPPEQTPMLLLPSRLRDAERSDSPRWRTRTDIHHPRSDLLAVPLLQ